MGKNTKVENFSLPNELVEKLNKHSKETMIPKSRLITKLLLDFFEKQKNK